MKWYPCILLLPSILLLAGPSSAQWSRTGGPYGGLVSTIQSNDQYLFAGSRNGIYRSDDAGHRWERLTEGLPFSFICYDLDVEGENLIFFGWDHIKNWAPTYRYQVYKSEDHGDQWTQVHLPDSVYFPDQVAIHDSIIFVADKSLLRSVDNGETWTTLLSYQDGFFNSGHQLEIYGDQLYVVALNKVWITDDWGDSWEIINFPPGSIGYNVFPKDSLLILIGEDEAYRSINDGATWEKATGFQGANTNWKDIHFLNDTFYVNSFNVLRSIDFGVSWDAVPPVSNGFYPYGLTLYKGGIYACSLTGGIRQFWPEAATSQIRDFGVDATSIGALSIHNNTLWAGVDYNGLYQYDMISQTWDSLNYFPEDYHILDIAWIGDSLFIVNFFGEVYRSGDQGHTWSKIYDSDSGNINEIVVIGTTLYVINGYVLEDKSDDYGTSWQPAFPTFHSQTNDYKGYCIPHHGYYFMSTTDQLYRSPDAGVTWEPVNTQITIQDGYIKKLRSAGPFLFMEIHEFNQLGDYNVTIYASTDDGMSWSAFMDGLPDITSYDPSFGPMMDLIYYPDTLVLATYSDGVYFRSSQDQAWLPLMVDDKFPRYTGVLALSGEKLFIGTAGMGVWQKSVDNTTPIIELASTVNALLIFPNPSSREIMIQMDEDAARGILFIVDMKGNVVFNTTVNGAKTYTVPIEQLPAGQYTVRLEANDRVYLGSFFKR